MCPQNIDATLLIADTWQAQATINSQYNLATAAVAHSLKDICSNFHADKYLNVIYHLQSRMTHCTCFWQTC